MACSDGCFLHVVTTSGMIISARSGIVYYHRLKFIANKNAHNNNLYKYEHSANSKYSSHDSALELRHRLFYDVGAKRYDGV